MAAKDDGGTSREEGDQRIVDVALQAVYRGTGKGKLSFGRVRVGMKKDSKVAKVAKMQIWERTVERMQMMEEIFEVVKTTLRSGFLNGARLSKCLPAQREYRSHLPGAIQRRGALVLV